MRASSLLLAGLIAGCGTYTVRVSPPPARPASAGRPLDLTVSLGELRLFRDGEPVVVDDATARRIDTDFVRAVNATGIVRAALPRGTRTDLYCDVTRELHAAPMDVRRTLYLFLLGPAAVLAPGVPYPWDYRIGRTVRVRGEVGDASVPLDEHQVVHEARVWGMSYWGGLRADPATESEGEYVTAQLADAIRRQPVLFERFASAARAGNVESAWLLGLTAGQDAARR